MAGVDGLGEDLLRLRLGDLFDLHAAGCRRDDDGPPPASVGRDAQVQFALDIHRLLDEHLVYRSALRAGLEGNEGRADKGLGDLGSLGGVVGDLHASGFAASSGVYLRFDDAPAAELGRRVAGFITRRCDEVLGYGYAIGGQEFLGLIFVELHMQGPLCELARSSMRVSRAVGHDTRGAPTGAAQRARSLPMRWYASNVTVVPAKTGTSNPCRLVWMSGPLALWERVRVRVPPVWM